jgi:hypothetical protein
LVLYKKIQFTISDFQSMVHGLVADMRRILREELMFAKEDEMSIISWPQLRDDPINKQQGWNFIRDERNQLPVDGKWWLFDRMAE